VSRHTPDGPLLGAGPFPIADINAAKGTVKLRRNPHSHRGVAGFAEVFIQKDDSGANLYFKALPVDTEIDFVG
jgi:ABC-type oligopeptide transport system substrate-binding subunit